MANSMGPKTEPLWTPNLSMVGIQNEPLMVTHCIRPVRKFENQILNLSILKLV